MSSNPLRDQITIEDEDGNEKQYSVEALFDMEEHSYALLSSDEDDEPILMRVEDYEDEQYLIGITNKDERNSILDAYQIAVEANPAEEFEHEFSEELSDGGERNEMAEKQQKKK